MAKRLMELMTTTTEPEMIESEIYSTVVEAVKETLVGTQVLALRISPQAIPGSSIDVVLQTKDSLTVQEIGEGQEIPIDVENVETFNLKPVKYGIRPLITREMQEDNKWDIVQRNIVEAGYQMAKKLDALLMAAIEAGNSAASHTVSGSTAITIDNITTAIYNLEYDSYKADTLIVSAEVAKDVRNIDTFVEADKAGISNPGVGLIGTIFGMKVYQTNQATAKYAYVLDSRNALILAEKRPITVERYDDKTRDLSGVVVTARWKARYLRANACSVITTA